jgi:hypothetical protein
VSGTLDQMTAVDGGLILTCGLDWRTQIRQPDRSHSDKSFEEETVGPECNYSVFDLFPYPVVTLLRLRFLSAVPGRCCGLGADRTTHRT